jgi:hypothetical protein
MQTLHIDMKKILEVAHLAARRATVFMAMGINAAEEASPAKYKLPTIVRMSFVPDEIEPGEAAGYKKEFGMWIVGSALRDLIDHISIFLDQLFEACWYFERHRAQTKPSHINQERKRFSGKSAADKIAYLKKTFGVDAAFGTYIAGLKNARNCLVHRLGFVGAQDCEPGTTTLTLRWLGMEVVGVLENGKTERIPPGQREPFGFSDAATVNVLRAERVKEFPLASRMQLEPYELAEICWMVHEVAQQLMLSAEAFARRCGVEETSSQ